MKTCLSFVFLLLFLSGCDKRCANFCGKWETEGYSAYINITRNGDSYFVTIQEKEGEPDWITRKHYVMYYKNGMLRSEFSGFKTIVYDSIKQAIRINDEKDEWKKVPSKSEL